MIRCITSVVPFLAVLLAWACFDSPNAMAQDSLKNLLQNIEKEQKNNIIEREGFSRQRNEKYEKQRTDDSYIGIGNFTCRFKCIAPGFTGGPNSQDIIRQIDAQSIGDATLKVERQGSEICHSWRRDTTLHKNQSMDRGHVSCKPTR